MAYKTVPVDSCMRSSRLPSTLDCRNNSFWRTALWFADLRLSRGQTQQPTPVCKTSGLGWVLIENDPFIIHEVIELVNWHYSTQYQYSHDLLLPMIDLLRSAANIDGGSCGQILTTQPLQYSAIKSSRFCPTLCKGKWHHVFRIIFLYMMVTDDY